MSRPVPGRTISMAAASKTVVLISGANTGIGYEIVKKLSAENPSFQILLGTRDIRKGEEAAASLGAPTNVNPIQLDLTDDTSIQTCYKTIEQNFGKLDILINNAATGGRDFPKDISLRERYNRVYAVNVIGTACHTEAMVPLLSESKLPGGPKIIFITSGLGSMARTLDPKTPLVPVPWYNSSKAAINNLCAYYTRKYPEWKVNACCPGLNATNLNHVELTEATHPRNGAINACRLATEGPESKSGTFTDRNGSCPW